MAEEDDRGRLVRRALRTLFLTRRVWLLAVVAVALFIAGRLVLRLTPEDDLIGPILFLAAVAAGGIYFTRKQ